MPTDNSNDIINSEKNSFLGRVISMKKFMDKDFLLSTDTSKKLFGFCKDEPIFDWHCHLSPKEIYENKKPQDITELWLGGDHYKWRAMRSCGIDEKYITGDASNYEKFKKYAYVMEKCLGNPLYHWTHLELQRYFGIYTPLSTKTADEIWEKENAEIANGGFEPRALIEKSNVVAVCTTDDPADSLEYHKLIAEDKSFGTKVYPAFRPDKALNITADTYVPWVKKLSDASGIKVTDFDSLKEALSQRISFFKSMGTRATDCSLTQVKYVEMPEDKLNLTVKKVLAGEKADDAEVAGYTTALFKFLGEKYYENDFVMEVHLGAVRNNNSKMFEKLGPDTGFDSIGDSISALDLSKLLNSLCAEGKLPKTILFNINPADNYIFGSMLGNFQDSDAFSKIQLGSGWWFNDNIDGMRAQLSALSNLGVLGGFVGMVTDSRSFLSYPRHEYFRRILCDFIGEKVENGEYPYDENVLSEMVKDISFGNAEKYFNLK